MNERIMVLLLAFGAGFLVLAAFAWYRRRWADAPERLDVDALGLELMTGCCAFVVFTTPSCRPCKAALREAREAAARGSNPTDVVSVDATDQPEIALRANVRTIPTIFLITASGHVVQRWVSVPERSELLSAIAKL